MNRSRSVIVAILVLLSCGIATQAVVAQDDPLQSDSETAVGLPAIEEVERQIKLLADLQAEEDLTDEDTTRLQLLRSAVVSLQAAAKSKRVSLEYDEKDTNAPVEIEAIRRELAEPPEALTPEVPARASLSALEEALRSVQAEADTARSRLREVEAILTSGKSASDEIRDQQAGLQHDLQEIEARIAALPLADESPPLTSARIMKLNADRESVAQWIELLTQERENLEARRDLLPLRRDRWTRRVSQLTALEAEWQKIVDEARAADIRRTREEASRAALRAHPVVAQIARDNLTLADRRDELRPDSEKAQRDLVGLDPDPDTLRRRLDRLQQKVNVVGMTSTVGLLLRRNRADLPDTRLTESGIRHRRALMAQLEYERLEREDERHALIAGQEDAIRQFMAGLDPQPPTAERAAIEREFRQLLQVRREYLDDLDNDLETYFNRLQALNESERQIVDLTDELTDFIDQHILWIQSARPLGTRDIEEAGEAVAWMFGPSDWRNIVTDFWTALKTRWPGVLVTGLAVMALVGFRRRLGSKIGSIGSSLTMPEEATIGQVALVAVLTILRASAWPAVLWFLGGLLLMATAQGGIELALAVGDAFQNSAKFLFVLMLAYETCQPHGLGEAHFGWRPRNIRVARRQVAWLTVVILAMGIPVSISIHQSNTTYETSLGRMAFIVAVVGLAFFVHGLLNPRTGVLRDHLARNRNSWANRLRYIWYPAAMLTPVALAVASALGYHYTALSLCRQILDSAAYLVIVVLIYYLALRWIQLGRRKMALEQARKRSAAYEERAARGEAADETRPAIVKGAQFDVSAISTQAMQMLRTAVLFMLLIGCFAIWSDSFPAIGVLENVELWPGAEVASSGSIAATDGDGIAAGGTTAEPVYEMVTLKDLLWAIVLTVLTMIVAKNIPGLLEITVLQHLPLERGSQFAISTIVRYTITIVGIAVAFRVIGVTWAKVQWLAAALTVGLGFGLNEIFGNFISGLIILFERPIRVGDTVTVGTTTGTVTQIKIRSTTLVDWDRKELIIPNKVFVTETITNWTLSSQLLRLVFPVTVEHGADLALAEEILLKVAKDQDNVVNDPAPSVMLDHVDDQGIEIDLRLFIPHIDHYVTVKHGVYTNIVARFHEAGIRFFNFSRRDIEVRSMSGAPIRLADTGEAEHPPQDSG